MTRRHGKIVGSLALVMLTLAPFAPLKCAAQDGSSSGPAALSFANRDALLTALRKAAEPLNGGQRDYDKLLQEIGDARYVLIGEATHGTEEFYRERARISQRLIQEKGFSAVII